MGKAIRVSALSLLLCCSAYAGEIQNGSPAPGDINSPPTADGEVQNGINGWMPNGVGDELDGAALAALNGALTLL
jgi:hypothetical protein